MCTQNENFEEPCVIGEKFERYVRDYLFVYNIYKLLDRAPPFEKQIEHFSESALKPDYEFLDRYTGRRFYVEAKYRSTWKKNMTVRVSYDDQLARYQSFNKKCPTFLILGVGGSPTQPALVTLIPIEMTAVEFHIKQVKPFQVDANRAIDPDRLWSAL
jgi:hypothetical protein